MLFVTEYFFQFIILQIYQIFLFVPTSSYRDVQQLSAFLINLPRKWSETFNVSDSTVKYALRKWSCLLATTTFQIHITITFNFSFAWGSQINQRYDRAALYREKNKERGISIHINYKGYKGYAYFHFMEWSTISLIFVIIKISLVTNITKGVPNGCQM